MNIENKQELYNGIFVQDKENMEIKTLSVGDWLIQIGIEIQSFYIQDIYKKDNIYYLRLGNIKWMVSNNRIIKVSSLKTDGFLYAGKGKKKWYWKYLPWRNIICPFTKPQRLWME